MQKWRWKMINIQAVINTLTLVIIGWSISTVQANTLNKCVDAYGKVTYSNLACKGAKQAEKIEIDPAPPVPKVVAPVVEVPSAEPGPSVKASDKASDKESMVKLETFGTAPKKLTANVCDSLSDKLGGVLDKMDAARRKGYTQPQMDKWNMEIKDLERKKQQAACF